VQIREDELKIEVRNENFTFFSNKNIEQN
jgi:hypothetical protein